jgi:hypothetical protein
MNERSDTIPVPEMSDHERLILIERELTQVHLQLREINATLEIIVTEVRRHGCALAPATSIPPASETG